MSNLDTKTDAKADMLVSYFDTLLALFFFPFPSRRTGPLVSRTRTYAHCGLIPIVIPRTVSLVNNVAMLHVQIRGRRCVAARGQRTCEDGVVQFEVRETVPQMLQLFILLKNKTTSG